MTKCFKYCTLLFVLLLIITSKKVISQDKTTLTVSVYGIVLDAGTMEPIENAIIRLPDIPLTATTNSEGKFKILNLKSGEYNIEVMCMGYTGIFKQLHLNSDTTLYPIFKLQQLSIETPVVIVTENKYNSKFIELKTVPTEIQGKELQQSMGFSLASILKNEAGIAMRTMGPAPARPVIRGLGGNRVVMTEDGVETVDLSGMSPDHAVTIDPFNANKIEIIRGPKALIYSNSPVGGIVNVQNNDVPVNAISSLIATGSGFFESANKGFMGSASIEAPIGPLIFKSVYSSKHGDDISSAGKIIQNTSLNTDFFNIGAGYNIHDLTIGVAFNNFNSIYGIPGGVTGTHPSGVDIEMLKNTYNAKILAHFHHDFFDDLQFNFSRTYYHHTEYEVNRSIGAEYVIRDYYADLKINQKPMDNFSGSYGLSFGNKDFQIGGYVFMPEVTGITISPFIYEEFNLDDLMIQMAARYSYNYFKPEKNIAKSNKPGLISRDFNSLSASMAVFYDLGKNIYIGTDISRISRAPQIEELYNEGPHLAAYTYDIGNALLDNETGFGYELYAYYKNDEFYAMITGFLNDMDYFIIPRNSGDTNYAVLLPIYHTSGVAAKLMGFEGMFEYDFLPKFHLSSTVSYTYGLINENNNPLPMTPPLKGNIELKYHLQNFSSGIKAEYALAQNRVDKYEERTDGYIIFGFYSQYQFNYLKMVHSASINIENILNTEYRNHLSRIKAIMPEPGINLRLFYRVYFN